MAENHWLRKCTRTQKHTFKGQVCISLQPAYFQVSHSRTSPTRRFRRAVNQGKAGSRATRLCLQAFSAVRSEKLRLDLQRCWITNQFIQKLKSHNILLT